MLLASITGVETVLHSLPSLCVGENLSRAQEVERRRTPTGSLVGAANRISRLSTYQRQKTIDKGPHIVQDGGGQLSDPPPNSEKERAFYTITPTSEGTSSIRYGYVSANALDATY